MSEKDQKAPVEMEARTVYDIVQLIQAGLMQKNPGNLVTPGGHAANMNGEPFYAIRKLNLRCSTIEEAETICKEIVQPGMEANFIIQPVYCVMPKTRWQEIDEQIAKHDEGGN